MNGGNTGGSTGGFAGTNVQGGNGGTGGSSGGSGGSAGMAGGGGTATPDAGTKADATSDASSDVSMTGDSGGNVDAGTDTSSNVDTGTSSDATGPADSGVDVGAALSCDAGEGLQLKSVPGLSGTGWVDRATNCVAIQGAIYIVLDGGGSNAFFTSVTNHFCVSGTAKHNAVIDSTHWGVTVALQLNNVSSAELPYDATAQGVTGFDFTLSGADIPAGLRAVYRVDGEATEYCKVITGGAGAKTILMSEAHPQCYLADAGSAVPTATQLRRLEFEVPANTTTDVTFDFCVDSLTAKKP